MTPPSACRALPLALAALIQAPWAAHALAVATPNNLVIPKKLHIMGKSDRMANVHPELALNVNWTLAQNDNLVPTYWGPPQCGAFVNTHYPQLAGYYSGPATEAMTQALMCRLLILHREGGYMLEPDVQLAVRLTDMVRPATSFMGVRHNSMMMASAPLTPILDDAVAGIAPYFANLYAGGRAFFWPAVWEGAFRTSCGCGMDCYPSSLDFMCGAQQVRLFREEAIDCSAPSADCPKERVSHVQSLLSSGQPGQLLEKGIVAPDGRLVGWSRHFRCRGWGCGEADYNLKDLEDMYQVPGVADPSRRSRRS